MIVAIVGTLEGFREKLQQTIDHVKSGVSHLNEDQIEKAQEMVLALHTQFDDVVDDCLKHLGVHTVSVPVSPAQPDDLSSHVIHLPKTWKQHDDAGREVTVNVVNGKCIAQIDDAPAAEAPPVEDAAPAAEEAKETAPTPKPLWGIGSVFGK